MSVGAFFDLVIWLALSGYIIYIAETRKDKLGNKAKWLKYGGIAMIVFKIIEVILRLVGG